MPIGTWSLPMPQSGCSGLTQRASTQPISSSACCVSDASFDWIYIDADHSYAGVQRAAAVAAEKVRPGGFLVFNDFARADPYLGAYGVHRPVVEFAVERKWPLVWLAYEANALYDVALKRPE
jgi:hypothetical protein